MCVHRARLEKGGPASVPGEAEKCLLCSHQSSSGHECSLAQEITGAQAQLLAILPKNHKNCRSRNEAMKTKLPGGLHQANAIIDRIDTRVQRCFHLPKLQQLPFGSSSLGVPTSRTDRCCPAMPVPPCSLWPKGVLSFQSSSTSHFSQT